MGILYKDSRLPEMNISMMYIRNQNDQWTLRMGFGNSDSCYIFLQTAGVFVAGTIESILIRKSL